MDYLKIIKKKKIQLTPVIKKNGKIEFWQAGYRAVHGWYNYIKTDGFSHGKTPEEAVDNLLAGKTEWIWDKTGFRKREE